MRRLAHVPIRNRTRLSIAISLILLYCLQVINSLRTEILESTDLHANYV